MGCLSADVRDEKDAPPITRDRSCRDVLFLILFLVFWGGMIVIGIFAFSRGNFKIVQYGLDSTGYVCGDNNRNYHDLNLPPPPPSPPPRPPPPPSPPPRPPSPSPPPPPPSPPPASSGRRRLHAYNPLNLTSGPDLSSQKYLFYYNPMEWGPQAALKGLSSLCVASCPNTTVFTSTGSLDTWPVVCKYFTQSSIAARSSTALFASAYTLQIDPWSTTYFTQLNALDKAAALAAGDCFAVLLPTRSYLGRCIPVIPQSVLDALAGTGSSNATTASAVKGYYPAVTVDGMKRLHNTVSAGLNTVANYVNDLAKGWLILFIGGFVAAVTTALLWLTIMRYFAGFMVWATVIFVNLLFVGVTLFSAVKGGLIASDAVGINFSALSASSVSGSLTTVNADQQRNFQVLTYIFAAAAGLLLLLTLLMASRLRVAIACLEVASLAINHMPLVLFFPLVTLAVYVAFIIWWIFVTVFLYSCGVATQDPATGAWELQWTRQLQYVGIYHLFGLLWTTQFLVSFSHVVIAGAVATFYWCRGDSESKEIRSPISTAFHRAWRYHLGSIALGSFIVAVVQFVRLVLEYVDRKTKKLQDGNVALKFLIACTKCCAWYLEKVVAYINRNAFIVVAIKGQAFCPSAGRAVALIVTNALRLVAVNAVGDVLMWLGKVLTALCGCLVAFAISESSFYSDPASKYYLSTPLVPIGLATIMAYAIGELFFNVYEMAVDTIMLSFCDDCDRNNGTPRFAPPELQAALGNNSPAANEGSKYSKK